MPNNARNHARNSPFPLTHVDFHLTHECLGPPHSPRQMTARSLYAFPHNDATNSPLVTMGRRKFTPKLPVPFDDHHQNLIHPYRARPHSPPQTASGSNQPFCHCSHVRTDRWATWNVDPISAPLYRSDALIILMKVLLQKCSPQDFYFYGNNDETLFGVILLGHPLHTNDIWHIAHCHFQWPSVIFKVIQNHLLQALLYRYTVTCNLFVIDKFLVCTAIQLGTKKNFHFR